MRRFDLPSGFPLEMMGPVVYAPACNQRIFVNWSFARSPYPSLLSFISLSIFPLRIYVHLQSSTRTRHYVYHIPELTPTVLFRQVEVGENHSLALTKAGDLYSWGHGDRGRLGVGASWRVGVPESEKNVFPTPMLLHTFSKEIVRQASCGRYSGAGLKGLGMNERGERGSRFSRGKVKRENDTWLKRVRSIRPVVHAVGDE